MKRLILSACTLIGVATIAGCATDEASTNDGLGSEEASAGEAWANSGATEVENENDHEAALGPDGPDDVASPAEDSAPFLDPDAAFGQLVEGTAAEQVQLEPEDLAAVKSCHRATAYRRGRASTICITQVDGKWVEVNTATKFLAMRTAARRAGVSIKVLSGFRTMAQQRYLYGCYKTKKCNNGNLAAPPGYSNHQSGTALDLNTTAGRGVYTWLANHARAYGFRRTVPSEKWHWER